MIEVGLGKASSSRRTRGGLGLIGDERLIARVVSAISQRLLSPKYSCLLYSCLFALDSLLESNPLIPSSSHLNATLQSISTCFTTDNDYLL